MAPNKILLLSPSASPNAQSQKVSTKAALWWACSRRDAERLSGLPKVTQLASAIQSIKTTRSPWLTAGKTLSTSAWLHSCLSSQLHSQLRQERQSGHWWGWESTSFIREQGWGGPAQQNQSSIFSPDGKLLKLGLWFAYHEYHTGEKQNPIDVMARTTRQKINKDIEDLKSTINH